MSSRLLQVTSDWYLIKLESVTVFVSALLWRHRHPKAQNSHFKQKDIQTGCLILALACLAALHPFS